MPTLPLPSGETALTGGDVPVSEPADVLAELPRPHRNADVAVVRDAIVEAMTEAFKEYQNIAARAAAQCDPLRATGDYLLDFAEERAVVPIAGESETSIRERIFKRREVVSPAAIVTQVDDLLSKYTTKTCHFSELNLDGYFVNDGTASWDSFVGAEPNYPDRYYDDLSYRLPGGAVPSWGYVRQFLLRIPALENADLTVSYEGEIFVSDGTLYALDGTPYVGVGESSLGQGVLYLFEDPQRAEDLYAQIISLVESIKGQGISWSLVVDPTL